jgi:hypothetical protein
METTVVQSIKLAVMAATDLSRDALHVHAGLIAYVGMCIVFRRPLRSFAPLFAAVAVAVFLELLDLRDDLATFGRWRVGASLHDIVNTAFWPFVLFSLARWTAVFRRSRE